MQKVPLLPRGVLFDHFWANQIQFFYIYSCTQENKSFRLSTIMTTFGLKFKMPYLGVAQSPFGADVQKFKQKISLWMGYFGQLISQKSLCQTEINYSPLLSDFDRPFHPSPPPSPSLPSSHVFKTHPQLFESSDKDKKRYKEFGWYCIRI